MPDPDAEHVYHEICDAFQQGLLDNSPEDAGFFQGIKTQFGERKFLTENQLREAKIRLQKYESRKKQGRLF